jgi:hypothetical protein
MKIEKKLRKCDNCGTEVEDQVTIGGHSANGWFEVSETNGSTRVTNNGRIGRKGPWDFCSKECLSEFIRKQE